LRASAAANAQACLRRIGHLVSLTCLFREPTNRFRVVKGIPLAIAAFQDPTLRDAGDIDLLIGKNDILKADEILRAKGYLRSEPQARLTPRRLRSYIAHQKDFSYEDPGSGMAIDLHWRLFRNPCFPQMPLSKRLARAWLNLGPERIPALPTSRLLLYLCVAWGTRRLAASKWLADIGALLRTMTPEQLRLNRGGGSVNSRRCRSSATAILLCQDMLGPHPAPAGCLDRNDRGSGAHFAFRQTAYDLESLPPGAGKNTHHAVVSE